MSTVISTPEGIARLQLIAVRGALKLEAAGMKSRGGSLRKPWAVRLGLKPSTPRAALIAHLTTLIEAQHAASIEGGEA